MFLASSSEIISVADLALLIAFYKSAISEPEASAKLAPWPPAIRSIKSPTPSPKFSPVLLTASSVALYFSTLYPRASIASF
jgi:hypothetical protein